MKVVLLVALISLVVCVAYDYIKRYLYNKQILDVVFTVLAILYMLYFFIHEL